MPLPLSLPFTLGGDLVVPPECELQPRDVGDEAVEQLVAQFRQKPRIEGVLRALSDGAQDFYDAALQVYIGRWIDVAEGVQLDEIGDAVDLARAGWVDETYRRLLKAQILVLASDGEWEDVFRVLRALGFTTMLGVDVKVAAMRVTLDDAPSDDITARDVFSLLERTREGGVRLTFEFPTIDPGAAFTFDADTTPDIDASRGFGDAVAGIVGGEFAAALATTGDA
jgi:hypothetical protein